MLDRKIWKLYRTCGNGQKRTKMWSVLLSNIQFLWFLQSMLLLSYLYQWCGFCWQKSMQKSVTTVCLHCSFARLNNKHIGVLGTNVAGYIGPQCLSIGLHQTEQRIVNRSGHVTCDKKVASISGPRHVRAGNGALLSCWVMAVPYVRRSPPLPLS